MNVVKGLFVWLFDRFVAVWCCVLVVLVNILMFVIIVVAVVVGDSLLWLCRLF